jgi:hypothetical protein
MASCPTVEREPRRYDMLKTRIAIVGGLLSILAALTLSPLVAQEGKGGHAGYGPALQKAIENTSSCYRVCEGTLQHCLEMGGKHAASNHINLLIDCAEICKTDLGFMARKSEFHPETCRVCADICQKCAESCEKLSTDDPAMKECAESCRRCAESCRSLATRGS